MTGHFLYLLAHSTTRVGFVKVRPRMKEYSNLDSFEIDVDLVTGYKPQELGHSAILPIQLSFKSTLFFQICELVHSPIGNYVATLEGSRGSKGASVRVYVNWSDPKVEGASLRPRIATR